MRSGTSFLNAVARVAASAVFMAAVQPALAQQRPTVTVYSSPT